MTKLIYAFCARLGHIIVHGARSPTMDDMHLKSLSSFGKERDLRYRPGRIPKFKLRLKPKLVAGMVKLVGELIGPVIAPVDVEANWECRYGLEWQW